MFHMRGRRQLGSSHDDDDVNVISTGPNEQLLLYDVDEQDEASPCRLASLTNNWSDAVWAPPRVELPIVTSSSPSSCDSPLFQSKSILAVDIAIPPTRSQTQIQSRHRCSPQSTTPTPTPLVHSSLPASAHTIAGGVGVRQRSAHYKSHNNSNMIQLESLALAASPNNMNAAVAALPNVTTTRFGLVGPNKRTTPRSSPRGSPRSQQTTQQQQQPPCCSSASYIIVWDACRRMWCYPQRWSLTVLLLLIVSLSTCCSILIASSTLAIPLYMAASSSSSSSSSSIIGRRPLPVPEITSSFDTTTSAGGSMEQIKTILRRASQHAPAAIDASDPVNAHKPLLRNVKRRQVSIWGHDWGGGQVGKHDPSERQHHHRIVQLSQLMLFMQPWQPEPPRPRLFSLGQELMSVWDRDLVVEDNDTSTHFELPDVDHPSIFTDHGRCQPLAAWQMQSFPTCNMIHEISLPLSTSRPKVADVVAEAVVQPLLESHQHDHVPDRLAALGEGWFRTTWKLDRNFAPSSYSGTDEDSSNDGRNKNIVSGMAMESVVLKTLRIAREYIPEYYELHRRDAVAMERLTASPFVVDVYGYCGQSAINEWANFPFTDIQSLESFNHRLRGREKTLEARRLQLRMATSLAVGMADIHAAGQYSIESNDDDDGAKSGGSGGLHHRPLMVHYDVNPRNVALFVGGRPKLNDFNIAEFLTYDPQTNETCAFPARLHEPWWRAPEEMNIANNNTNTILVDEKVDVYALGNLLYQTLTTHSPRGKMHTDRMDEVRQIVAAGIPPILPDDLLQDKDPTVLAIRRAMDLCFEPDPTKRGSAQQVANLLMTALRDQVNQHQQQQQAAAAIVEHDSMSESLSDMTQEFAQQQQQEGDFESSSDEEVDDDKN